MTLSPRQITESINVAIKDEVERIVLDESNKAAERVKQRVVELAAKIGFMATHHSDPRLMRDEVVISVRIDQPDQDKAEQPQEAR